MLYVSFDYTTTPSVHIGPASRGLPLRRETHTGLCKKHRVPPSGDSGPRPSPLPSERQPDSGPGLPDDITAPAARAGKPSSQQSLFQKAAMLQRSPPGHGYMSGVGVGAGAGDSQWSPCVPANEKLASLSRQGHPKLISQTPPELSPPLPGTPRQLLGWVPVLLLPGPAQCGASPSLTLCSPQSCGQFCPLFITEKRNRLP